MLLENQQIKKIFSVSAKTGENANNMFNFVVDGFFEGKYTLNNTNESAIIFGGNNNSNKVRGKKSKPSSCC